MTGRAPGVDREGGRSDSRALTPVVGIVLLVGIVVLGTAVVTLVGGAVLGDTRQSVEIASAENAMGELDARASDTALGLDTSSARAVEFGHTGPDGHLETTRDSWMRVSIVDATTGVESASVVNETMGTVTYRHGERTVAYEGGGVWRGDGPDTTMLSPPEFHFRNTTLTLPIVSLGGDVTLGERFVVQQNGTATRKYPNASAGLDNRVQDSKVTVTVHSDYYLAWGQYFDDTTDGIVTYDHGAQTATVKFLSLPRFVGLNDGIVATSGVGELRIGGTGVYVDSYDSRIGSYPVSQGENASLSAAGDVVNRGDMELLGNISSGAFADIGGNPQINGSVRYTTGYSYSPSANSYVQDGFDGIAGVAEFEPIDGYVLDAVADARESNDNAAGVVAGVIVDGDITGSGTLEAGTYYARDLDIEKGDRLILDTSGGDVNIAVEDAVSIVGDGSGTARILINGSGTVRLFVVGDEPTDFVIGKNGRIDVTDSAAVADELPAGFRVYGTQDFDAEITSNSGNPIHMEAVIYAPAGRTGTGSVIIRHAEFYGAIVTGNLSIDQGAKIHYDLGLGDERFPRSPTVSRLEYMHVAVHPIDVTNR